METKISNKRVIEVDWGIAHVSGNGNIYLNRNLKSYNPELYEKILQHEHSHDLGGYTTNDLVEDMSVNFFSLKDKIKFCLKHPKGWLFLSPIMVVKNENTPSGYEIMISWFFIFQYLIYMGLFIMMYVFWVN